MDFARDKQFFYGSAATILAPGMPMDTKGLNLGGLVKADILLSGRNTLRVGFEAQRYRLHDWWPPSPSVLPPGYATGGMAPDTFININNGQRDRIGVFAEWEARWNPKWVSLLGARSDTVMTDTGTVQGYNSGMMYNGMPLYPATTFNASNRQRTAGLRGRLRQKDAFAEPLRALRLVDKHDGNGDGELRRRWQLLYWEPRPEAGSGQYLQRDRQLA
jgi:iron complex outermembrane receptor protein